MNILVDCDYYYHLAFIAEDDPVIQQGDVQPNGQIGKFIYAQLNPFVGPFLRRNFL